MRMRSLVSVRVPISIARLYGTTAVAFVTAGSSNGDCSVELTGAVPLGSALACKFSAER